MYVDEVLVMALEVGLLAKMVIMVELDGQMELVVLVDLERMVLPTWFQLEMVLVLVLLDLERGTELVLVLVLVNNTVELVLVLELVNNTVELVLVLVLVNKAVELVLVLVLLDL